MFKKDSKKKGHQEPHPKEKIEVKFKVNERLPNNTSRRRSSRMEHELPDSGR